MRSPAREPPSCCQHAHTQLWLHASPKPAQRQKPPHSHRHVPAEKLPKSLMRAIGGSSLCKQPHAATSLDQTYSYMLQTHAWDFISAQRPLSDISIVPKRLPEKAELAAIRAGLRTVRSAASGNMSDSII